MQVPNSTTDVTTYFVLRDSTNHAPKTDVTITDIDLYYCEQGAAMAAKVDATALAAADSAHADNKAYNCGQALYRVDWPNAAFDGGVGKVVNLIVVCAGVDTTYLEVELTGVAQTGDSYARLGAPAGASVSADIAAVKTQTGAIEADTQDLQTQIGTDGAGLTAIGDTRLANLDATVSSRHAAGAAVAKSPATLAAADVSGNLPVDVQTIKTQAVTAAAPVTVPASIGTSTHSAADVKTALEADGGKLDHLWEMTEDDGGVRRLTGNALEQAPASGTDTPGVTELLTRVPDATPGAIGGLPLSKDASGRVEVASATDKNTLDALLTALQGAGWTDETLASLDVLLDAIKAKTDLITTGTALTIVNPVVGSTITTTIAASLAATLSGLAISADWAKVYLTVKGNEDDDDSEAKLQVVVSNPAAAATDGCLRIWGAAATDAQRLAGSLTVNQATGSLAIALEPLLTTLASEATLLDYDLKEVTATGDANVLVAGSWSFVRTPTKSL